MRIPQLSGRGIDASDRLGMPGALVVNRMLAEQVWPAGNAVGQRVLLGGGGVDSVWRTVVGVVGDVRHRGLAAPPRPEMYLPYDQFPAGTGTAQRSLSVVIRTAGDPLAMVVGLRAAVAELDPDVPLTGVQTMEDSMGRWAAERRLLMLLVSSFAALALTLGAVGIYGVMTHLVAQREREIGVRVALGAVPREIVRLVTVQGMTMVGVGIAIGAGASLAATRVLRSLLFGVRPSDPATLAATALVLTGVAAAAMLVPAVRATQVDPIEALRAD
jgi:predicted lysophospholipase L1 biosynthesis ABC-type transport system permease subunit